MIKSSQGTKRVAHFSESLGMQFAIVHHSADETEEDAQGERRQTAALVGTVKVIGLFGNTSRQW